MLLNSTADIINKYRILLHISLHPQLEFAPFSIVSIPIYKNEDKNIV